MRDDLQFLDQMVEAGFTPEFHYQDKRHNRTSAKDPATVPHWPVSFKQGELQVWKTKDGWQVAQLVGQFYTNHRGMIRGQDKPLIDRFPETQGYIPSLENVIELFKAGTL